MKLTAILLTIAFLQVHAKSFPQITLSLKNVPVEKVFYEIERQAGYGFLYTRAMLSDLPSVTIKVKNAPVKEVLNQCFRGQPMEYSIESNMIVVKRKTIAKPSPIASPDPVPPVEIRGRVLNASGEPIQNVSVSIVGSQTGTATNTDGRFALTAPDNKNIVLEFSSVGYQTKRVTVGNQTEVNVVLEQDVSGLDDVVVVGYESVKRSDLTGSVGTLKMGDVSKAPVSSFVEAMAGRIAGVQVSSAEGTPGELPDIIIRGPGSATQGNGPLYVIDGFPTEDADQTRLNIDDIESVSVLKDASATAIYGSRAANGVIVIETKRGKISKPVVSYNAFLGYQPVPKMIPMMDAYEYVKLESEFSSQYDQLYMDSTMTLEDYKNVKSIDWQELVFRPAITQSHSIAVRGGSAKTKYSLSGSIYKKNGMIIHSDYNRVQGRLALDQEVTKNITVGITADYNRFNTSGQQVSEGAMAYENLGLRNFFFMQVWGFPPVARLSDTLTDGQRVDLTEQERDPSNETSSVSPLTTARNNKQSSATALFTTNMYMNYEITKNLTLRLRGAFSSNSRENDMFRPARAASLTNVNGTTATYNTSNNKSWSTDNTLTWKKKINAHHVDVMAGFSVAANSSSSFGYATRNIPVEALGIYGISIGSPTRLIASGNESRLSSYFGRLNYNYQSKYLFTFTYRGDGSSKFIEKNRWGYFPSGAVAWNMHKERFFENLSFISNSKLRFSYGFTGNNRVGAYAAYPLLNIDYGYSFNNTAPLYAAIPASMGNSDLRWEAAKQIDLGYELGLFDNRFTIEVDLYRKITQNMLLNASLPGSIGFTSAFENIGSMKNEGLELSFNSVNISSSAFRWLSSFNISFNKNTILSLANGQDNLFTQARFSSAWAEGFYRAEVGQPLGMMYGLIYEGPYPYSDFNRVGDTYVLKDEVAPNGGASARAATRPGDMKYRDINGDGNIDVNDRVNIGRGQPIHTGGFLNNFFYRGFEASFFFQWSYGNNLMNANRIMLEGNESQVVHFNQYASYADRWTEDNQNSKNFRYKGDGPAYFSNRVLEDGSYLRLKTVFLGYQFSNDRIRKIGMSSLKVGVQAQNLLTWTNYSGLDPEVSVMRSVLTPSFDFSAYPQGRIVTFSVNASF